MTPSSIRVGDRASLTRTIKDADAASSGCWQPVNLARVVADLPRSKIRVKWL